MCPIKRIQRVLLSMAAILTIQASVHAYQVFDYATADALITGTGLAAGFPITSPYTLASVQDNGRTNQFGLGTQIVGLPGAPTDSDDFVFVGSGSLTVNTSGTYNFFTGTDDGSRVRISINGGATQQIITDNVLSAIHTAASDPLVLTAGDKLDFDWMWFERGGEAAGDFFYNRAGVDALVGDPAQGLSLDGGSFSGKLYKAVPDPIAPLPPAPNTPVLWDPADGGNGHVYMLIDSAATWHEARDGAGQLTSPPGYLAGHLVTVSDSAENEFLVGQFGSYGRAWLGFTDEQVEGEWRWIDDTPGIWQDPDNFANPIQNAFTAWDPTNNEPNDYFTGEDYGVVFWDGTSLWNDFGLPFADERTFYVAEFEPVPEPAGAVLAAFGFITCAFVRRRTVR